MRRQTFAAMAVAVVFGLLSLVPAMARIIPGICSDYDMDYDVDPTTCRQYYTCLDRQATLVRCQPGTMFNPHSRGCQYPGVLPPDVVQKCRALEEEAAKSDNFALQKTTVQSSVAYGGVPAKAVDGNTGGNFDLDGCTHTNFQTNPWWSVDLGKVVNVTGVRIVNRNDCCSARLHDFSIGVTNENPSEIIPVPGRYDICSNYNGVFPSSGTVKCDKVAMGRYLVIQIEGMNEVVTLCEVEVQGQDVCHNLFVDYVPYPTTCRKYYSCVDGQALLSSCRPGTRWNYITNSCMDTHQLPPQIHAECTMKEQGQ